ncbi:MAG: hypothetical protein ACP5LS_06255 [Thermoprotei archaeon]
MVAKKKVSETVRFIIRQNAMYQFLVNSGLVNSNALARQIKDTVQTMTGKEVKVNTIAKIISSMRPSEVKPYVGLLNVDVSLDTDVEESTYSFDEFKELDLSQVYLALVNDGKVVVLKRKSSPTASDSVLLKVTFRGGATAYHPFWLLFNSLGVEVKHVIRHDNVLFIFLRRSDAVEALAAIEKFSAGAKPIGSFHRRADFER